jgi:hypothetical protein
MTGYYNASRDPRKHSDDGESDRVEELMRKKPRMDRVEAEVQVVGLTSTNRYA